MDDCKDIEQYVTAAEMYLNGSWVGWNGGDNMNFKTEIDRILHPQKWNFKAINSNESLWVEIRIGESPVGWFRLSYFPMCRHILVSTDAEVSEKVRGKGLGKILHRLRLELAKSGLVQMLLCTARADNEAQNKILLANDWKIKETITIRPCQESKYKVNLWVKTF